MGLCSSCCRDDSSETVTLTPDPETRRQQQAEAAEKRFKASESRGIKDPQGLKQKQARMEELEKRQREQSNTGEAPLRWNVG